MHFTRFAPAAAGLIGAAHALVPGLIGDSDIVPALFDLGSSWDDEVLFQGVVGAETETDAAIHLGLNIKEAQVEGDIAIEALEDFISEPNLRLDLAGVKAYFELDISADAALYQTVELVASPHLNVDAGLLEVTLGAAFALDLIVAVDAAIDVSAGFYLAFQEGDFIDISILTKDIVDSKLEGLVTKALPVGVGAEVDLSAEIEVQLGLRLRSHVVVEAGVDLLGLDVLNAGAEVAIWADLMTHTIVLVETDDCLLSVDNKFALALGIAVDLSVEVLDILDISLAPEVTITLATAIGAQVCLDNRGETGEFLVPQVEPKSSTLSATPTGAPNATVTNGNLITSTHSETKTYTITSCHASVPNCPASQTQKIVTSTVVSSVTVCPADQTEAPVPTSTKSKKPVHTITETLTTVVPCEPTSSTYTPPTTPPPNPTVTISDSVTVCPTETEGQDEPPKPTAPITTPVPEPTKPSEPEQPEQPEQPEVPEVPEQPEQPEEPTAPITTPQEPPTMPTAVPSWSHPAPNSTWTSVVTPPPGSTWIPPPSTTPTQPPTAGAGAVKVGIAMALPAVVAMML